MTYIIAEIGVNHDGCLTRAIDLIDHAAHAGADCVKFQLFEHLHEPHIEHLALSREALEYTRGYAKSIDMDWLCSPFTPEDATALWLMGEERMKVASIGKRSTEWYLSLVEHIKGLGVDTILSTGGMDFTMVETVFDMLHPSVVLQCTSAYPCPWTDVNLRVMDSYRAAFGVTVGLSDHTEGIIAPIVAAANGAEVIEKHLTYDTKAVGPDHAASLAPYEFHAMVTAVRGMGDMMGDGYKRVMESER